MDTYRPSLAIGIKYIVGKLLGIPVEVPVLISVRTVGMAAKRGVPDERSIGVELHRTETESRAPEGRT